MVLERGDPIDHKEADGRTALSRVASAGSPEIAKLLLSLGASPDLKENQGNTPRLLAERYGGPDMKAAFGIK